MNSPEIQERFYRRLASADQLGALFDSVPGILYFVKDREGLFISANRTNLSWLGLESEQQLVGRSDADFFPPEMANKFAKDDQEVIASATPVVEKPELIVGANGVQKWFLTTKRPLTDGAGEVIGVAGITQSLEDLPPQSKANAELQPLISFIRDHQDRVISVEEMATISSMSERQLYRRFKAAFQITPQRFALLTRLRSVRSRLADTDQPISEIAHEFGFCDQSALSRSFRKEAKITPLEFRRKMRDSKPGE
ncbi:MAG: helix-turn-helix domain-containing protein [Verrucomicrobiales bacterium]